MKSAFRAAIILFVLCFAFSPALAQKSTMAPTYGKSEPRDLYQDDVGGEYISVIGVRSLDSVIDDMQPQFNLTADAALKEAVPDTLNSSESALSSLNATLQLGLLFSPSTSATSPPNATIPSQIVSPLSILTNLPAAGIDPVLQYRAAASLYEQVKLLNRSLKDIPHFHGFTPYIVTLQVALIPYRRDAPYDAYADIAFFTDTNVPPTSPDNSKETIPLVYPLPASDALEMSNEQQSQNQLRQLGFALAAAFHGVGIQAGVDKLNQNLEAAGGFNLNSLITVGKLSPNCIKVRIGARNQMGSASRLNMVPESHNISFLIFAPTNAGELQMVSHTVFRNVINDEISEENPDEIFYNNFLTNVLAYFLRADTVPDSLRYNKNPKNPEFQKTFRDFADHVFNIMFDTNSVDISTNNIANLPVSRFRREIANFFTNTIVQTALKKAFKNKYIPDTEIINLANNPFEKIDVNEANAIWLDLTRVGELGDQYANDLIPLPIWVPKLPPTNQTVLYSDDNESTVLVFDNGGKTLPTEKMTAILTATNGIDTNITLTLYSHRFQSDGAMFNVTFSPLSEIQPPNADSPDKTNHWRLKHIDLVYGQEGENYFFTNTYANFAFLNNSKNNKSAEKPFPWKITRTYGSLIAGAASNVFSIVLATNSPEATNNTWFLDVASPIVLTNSPLGGVLAKYENGLYQLQVPTGNSYEVTFTFGPLLAGQTVDFNLLDKDQTVVTNMNHQVVSPSQTSASGANGGKPNTP